MLNSTWIWCDIFSFVGILQNVVNYLLTFLHHIEMSASIFQFLMRQDQAVWFTKLHSRCSKTLTYFLGKRSLESLWSYDINQVIDISWLLCSIFEIVSIDPFVSFWASVVFQSQLLSFVFHVFHRTFVLCCCFAW